MIWYGFRGSFNEKGDDMLAAKKNNEETNKNPLQGTKLMDVMKAIKKSNKKHAIVMKKLTE